MSNLIDLTKKAQIVLEKKNVFGEKAQIVMVIDISGSMSPLYQNGTVQELTDRSLAIGMNMDDDKSIDVFTFGQNATEIKPATGKNHSGFIDEMLKTNRFEGGTRCSGVMEKVIKKFGTKKGYSGQAKRKSPLLFSL